MGRYYYSYEENEAYKEGRRDESYHRNNYEHDRYSDNPADRAYYEGREDKKREAELQRQEEREYQEYMERQRFEQEEQARREEEYNQHIQSQIEDQMHEEEEYLNEIAMGIVNSDEDIEPQVVDDYDALTESIDNITEITEEDLFNQIQKDEREE